MKLMTLNSSGIFPVENTGKIYIICSNFLPGILL